MPKVRRPHSVSASVTAVPVMSEPTSPHVPAARNSPCPVQISPPIATRVRSAATSPAPLSAPPGPARGRPSPGEAPADPGQRIHDQSELRHAAWPRQAIRPRAAARSLYAGPLLGVGSLQPGRKEGPTTMSCPPMAARPRRRHRRDRRRGRDRDHDRPAREPDRAAGQDGRAGGRGRARRRRPSSAGSAGSTTPACGSCTRRARCAKRRSAMTPAALSHGYWGIALGIGLVAALVVAALLVMLIRASSASSSSVGDLLDVAGKVAAQHGEHPAADATAPVLADRPGGRYPGRLHERAHRRLRRAA